MGSYADFLISEIKRYETENNRVPRRDDMKLSNGYPSSYQFKIYFSGKSWNELLVLAGLQPNNSTWTEEEDKILFDYWQTLTDRELAKKLKRTKNAVSYRRNELKLLRQSPKRVWQDWERKYLANNFYDGDKEEICKFLYPRTWETIRAYATKQLGLNRRHKDYKYQVSDGKRLCKDCFEVFEENEYKFYKDRNG
jgi:hypothetical protein